MGTSIRGFATLTSSLLLAACTTGTSGGQVAPSASPASPTTQATPAALGPGASQVPGGCATTPVHVGGLPAWTASAQAPSLPFVVSHEGNLVGVVFGYPLTSPPRQTGPDNKILWIVREPRAGSDLALTLRPQDGGDAVTVSEPPDSSPGEIYPSIVDVPAPGCWQVVAEWNGHRATLELSYRRR
jgi:hypothetical protein